MPRHLTRVPRALRSHIPTTSVGPLFRAPLTYADEWAKVKGKRQYFER